MERLTWRWLWIWVGVLVAGCTHVWSSDGTPVPTREPTLPLLGYSQNVHTLHHLAMWWLIIFAIVHMYMAVREDIFTGETVVSTMVNGWRVEKE